MSLKAPAYSPCENHAPSSSRVCSSRSCRPRSCSIPQPREHDSWLHTLIPRLPTPGSSAFSGHCGFSCYRRYFRWHDGVSHSCSCSRAGLCSDIPVCVGVIFRLAVSPSTERVAVLYCMRSARAMNTCSLACHSAHRVWRFAFPPRVPGTAPRSILVPSPDSYLVLS